MKKQTIWVLTILMALTFMGLLCMQIFYMRSMVQMRYDQFAQAARQSLLAVSVRLSHDETQRYLEEDVNNLESKTLYGQYFGEGTPRLGGVRYSFTTASGLEADLTIKGTPSEITNIQNQSVQLKFSNRTIAKVIVVIYLLMFIIHRIKKLQTLMQIRFGQTDNRYPVLP